MRFAHLPADSSPRTWKAISSCSLGSLLLATALAPACAKQNDVSQTDNSKDDAAAECAAQTAEIAKSCPAGTRADTSVETGECAPGEKEARDDDGDVIGVCVSSGTCQVACIADLKCECGMSVIGKDEIVCSECPSVCGNAELEDGEQCDLGNANGQGSGCTSTCLFETGPCPNSGAFRCASPYLLQKCIGGLWSDFENCKTEGDLGSKCVDYDEDVAYCQPNCASNERFCDDACIDVKSDVENCGGCGIKALADASDVNSVAVCNAGTPSVGCADPYTERCGSPAACVNTKQDVDNCGGCGKTCENDNGTVSCTNGSCTPNCDATHLDCDLHPENGCELDMTTDAHCGSCDTSCSADQSCLKVGSSYTCVTPASFPFGLGSNGIVGIPSTVKDLIVPAGGTLTLKAGMVHDFRNITVQAGAVLAIEAETTGGFTYLGVAKNLVLEGTIMARANGELPPAGGRTLSGTAPDGELLFHTVTQAQGGVGGVTLNALGRLPGQPFAGNGGGGVGWSYRGQDCNWVADQSGGYTFGKDATADAGGDGGYGEQGVHHAAGAPIYAAAGGDAQWGSGCSTWGPTCHSGGGGGGSRGHHGQALYVYVRGNITGSGTIDVSGEDGGRGGNGANGYDTGGCYVYSAGAGGGGGAGGAGGRLVFRHARPLPSGFLSQLKVAGGKGGAAGQGGSAPAGGAQTNGNPGNAGAVGSLDEALVAP